MFCRADTDMEDVVHEIRCLFVISFRFYVIHYSNDNINQFSLFSSLYENRTPYSLALSLSLSPSLPLYPPLSFSFYSDEHIPMITYFLFFYVFFIGLSIALCFDNIAKEYFMFPPKYNNFWENSWVTVHG